MEIYFIITISVMLVMVDKSLMRHYFLCLSAALNEYWFTGFSESAHANLLDPSPRWLEKYERGGE
jgi:hypothetical protein